MTVVIIDWNEIKGKAVDSYGKFVSSYAETSGVESEFALEYLYEELKKQGIDMNKPEFK